MGIYIYIYLYLHLCVCSLCLRVYTVNDTAPHHDFKTKHPSRKPSECVAIRPAALHHPTNLDAVHSRHNTSPAIVARPSTTANSWTTKDQVSPDDGAAQDETVGPGCASSCRPAYGNLHNHALFFPAVPNSTRRTSPSGPSRDRRAPKPQQRPHDRPPLGGLDGPGMGCWAQPSSSSVECGRSTDLSLVPRTLSLGPCRPTD
ncbi:hypothetical protein F5883DRAFT_90460 [Diaporthe sp. PMI_573]|nr:hypothetical protein F5883DRAFT_90460 [Diaporthaceae sp. PMI_573]